MSRRLLLVGWDSADWKIMRPLMEAGHLPAVSALVRAGVSGDCATLEPQLSPMLWTSIATGKMAYHHGVYGFTEVHERTGQVAPVSAATRRCKTLWEMLGEHGLTAHVVGWFATQGERLPRGCLVSNLFPHLQGIRPDQAPSAWPAPPAGTFWPPELAGVLGELRISPFEVEDVLRLLVPDCASIDQEKDPRLMQLAQRIAEAYSVHAATVWLMENRPDWDFFAVYFRAIDEICHTFMPYHQPGLPGVTESDIALYGQVVTGAYRLHDLMLARLLDLAGQGTATMLVSDHGFHSDHLRPQRTPNVPAGITVWHRRHGVLAAAGPAFRPRTHIIGAGLLDIAPTILHYYGLPVGRDMEGRVLADAFQEPGEVRSIPSWESTGTTQPSHELAADAADAAQLLDHFVALGYIDRPSDDPGEAAAAATRENKWNLARAHFHVGRYEDVLPLMEDCFFEFPERPDFSQLLAQAQVKLGLLAEAEETVGICLEMVQDGLLARLIQARIALLRGDHLRALAVLDAIRSRAPENPEILSLLARAYFFNRRWAAAEQIARQALERDAGHTFSKIVLARCALRRQAPREAVDWALAAVAENFADPQAFHLLGVAYSQLGDWANAEAALLNHLRLRPRHAAGLRHLVRVYRRSGDIARAAAGEATLAARVKETASGPSALSLSALRRDIAARREARHAARASRRREAPPPAAAGEFLIVSGLPRSGTSLMMQILHAGGIAVMTDGTRSPDTHNPEGYFEWEPIKSLRRHPRVIEQTAGKAVKVVAPLLPFLPGAHRYRIIYMTRPIEQVVASQCRMLGASAPPEAHRDELTLRQETQQHTLLEKLSASKSCELLEISYPDLISSPALTVARVADFLGVNDPALRARMSETVRPDLHRNRQP